MLTFTSLGGKSFRVTGGGVPIIAYPEKVPEKSENVLTLLSAPEENPPKGTLSWPGEYNIAEISLKGIGHTEGQQVSYVAELDGVRCAFLSSPLQDWTDHELEVVGDIDLLALPTDDPKIVQKLVDAFDPRILIILHGKDAGDFSASLKAVGGKNEPVEEYKLKGAMPAEGREVVVLAK
ncbi:MAG: hypothetical protein Q7R81_07935 [Candidatus Peregrinibacteria bacterium]|nr:hypothetical protein [Candidatus Peregrinibacteria bacterium]